jgi:hypothetical protein
VDKNIISFDLVGTTPLMVNSPRGVDPRDEIGKQIKLITDKGKRMTDEDQELVLRLKFEQSLYFDDQLGPYLPAYNVVTSIMKAAGLSRSGKKIERGVYVMGNERLPILYKGPRDIQSMWNGGFADIRPVKPSGAGTVLGCRALFRDWKITDVSVMLDLSQIDPRAFCGFLSLAGQIMGVGTYRRRFGRFAAWVEGKEIGTDGLPLKESSKQERLAA